MVRSMRSPLAHKLRKGFDAVAALTAPFLPPDRTFPAAQTLAALTSAPLHRLGWNPAVNHDGAHAVLLREWAGAYTRRRPFPIHVTVENEAAIRALHDHSPGLIWVSAHNIGNNLAARVLTDWQWPNVAIARGAWPIWGLHRQMTVIAPSPRCLVAAKRALASGASVLCEIDQRDAERTRASSHMFSLARLTGAPLIFFRGEAHNGQARVRTALGPSAGLPRDRYIAQARTLFEDFVRSWGGPPLVWDDLLPLHVQDSGTTVGPVPARQPGAQLRRAGRQLQLDRS